MTIQRITVHCTISRKAVGFAPPAGGQLTLGDGESWFTLGDSESKLELGGS